MTMRSTDELRRIANEFLRVCADDPSVHVCSGCGYDIGECNQGPDC